MPETACFLLKHNKNKNALVTPNDSVDSEGRETVGAIWYSDEPPPPMWSPASGPCQEKCSLRWMHSCYYHWWIQNKNDNHIVWHGSTKCLLQHETWPTWVVGLQLHKHDTASQHGCCCLAGISCCKPLTVWHNATCTLQKMMHDQIWLLDVGVRPISLRNNYLLIKKTQQGYVPPTRTQLIF